MKKQSYMAPRAEVQNVKLQQMIATSIKVNRQNGVNDESLLLGRQRGGGWDDDED